MNALTSLIKDRLKEKDLSFADFMQMALYHPKLGYYSQDKEIFGGDFITAPELSPLFGYTLASQCQQILASFSHPCLLEFGAGTGRLAVDILTELERLNSLPSTYYILELSHNLKDRQKALIQASIPHLYSRVQWLDTWPSEPFEGLLIANEVLDAMPVHRFCQSEQGLLESYLRLDDQGDLSEVFKPCSNSKLSAYLERVLPKDLSFPYVSEANLLMEPWIKEAQSCLKRGGILLLDYGFSRAEYYHPDRNQGTLMCHSRHKSHGNPFISIGEQDITAHVDFTHVAEAADQALLKVAGFSNQAAFLLGNGFLHLLERDSRFSSSESLRLKSLTAAKLLLQEHEMGELFKVMALTKNMDLNLNGFQLQDRRMSL